MRWSRSKIVFDMKVSQVLLLHYEKDGVSRFRGVETFEQYLEQRTPLAPVQPARNYTGQTVLQLAKNRPANDAPVVGMGDTQLTFKLTRT